MSLHVFGIRHHGPGCARSLRAALHALAPDVVLVEGPADAGGALSLLGAAQMVPPVALLIHAQDDPQCASFYPFAEFSPEWQALRYSAERGVPARFMDLPAMHTLAMRRPDAAAAEPGETQTNTAPAQTEPEPDPEASEPERALREDPIGLLAEAAGFADHEQFWDLQVEQRMEASGLFDAILEAMSAVREHAPPQPRRELQREAYMRNAIRAASKEGFERIAVVCGAWHAPVLRELGSAKADAALLKGLPKRKVEACWIPWTHDRLTARSGYGAGVDSPGWYAEIWHHGPRAGLVFATRAARLLREQDLEASAASAIETVRLADTLASLRELPSAGLGELREAVLAVLAGGEPARLALIRARLEIGDAIGQVPEHAARVPLMRDFEQQVKHLRLKLQVEAQTLSLDLRKERDRERSQLFHRLRVLGVLWATPVEDTGGMGTFREAFQLAWSPELAVDLITANAHGNTVEQAATAALCARARHASLSELTQQLEVALLAQLPNANPTLLAQLDARSADSNDVREQMEALEPLARVVRYGDVRGTRAEHVRPVLTALFERVIVGVVPACCQLDDEAAAAMVAALTRAHGACLLLDDRALKDDWLAAIAQLSERAAVHARMRGRACRMLLEHDALTQDALATRTSLALSSGTDPTEGARFIEGLVEGEGLRLAHQQALLCTLDGWIATLPDEAFRAQLPLLRRAFSSLTPSERRAVAERIKRATTAGADAARGAAPDLDPARAAHVLPVLARILGVELL